MLETMTMDLVNNVLTSLNESVPTGLKTVPFRTDPFFSLFSVIHCFLFGNISCISSRFHMDKNCYRTVDGIFLRSKYSWVSGSLVF